MLDRSAINATYGKLIRETWMCPNRPVIKQAAMPTQEQVPADIITTGICTDNWSISYNSNNCNNNNKRVNHK